MAATTVFPEPTSPSSKRFMGLDFSISCKISQADFLWALVILKGRELTKFLISSWLNFILGEFCFCHFCFCSKTNSWIKNNSLNPSRWRAKLMSSGVCGKWIFSSASLSPIKFWDFFISSGRKSIISVDIFGQIIFKI